MKTRCIKLILSSLVITLVMASTCGCRKEETPSLVTLPVTNITPYGADCGGNITNSGSDKVISRGLVWSINNTPTIEHHIGLTVEGQSVGVFTSKIDNLQPNTSYFVRSYALNSAGIAYGQIEAFKTPSDTAVPGSPSVLTGIISNVTSNSAICGGNVISDGGSTVTARGVCWSATSNPSITNSKSIDGNGTGSFISAITGLAPNTNYYLRAYAINVMGTSYGDEIQFTTNNTNTLPPTVTTAGVINITANSAVSGGDVISDGGAPVTSKGVCWSVNQMPTIVDDKTSNGSGLGSFVSNLTSLPQNTNFYVRAYATNSAGTGYGNQVQFSTLSSFPVFDIDGNGYDTVHIGTQIWLKSNLKATHYNNGGYIPNVTTSTTWTNLLTGARCYYNNDSAAYAGVYGVLYNWYVVGSGNLCPTGWHVPSEAEWTILTNFVGDTSGTLKEAGTAHWLSPNVGATNLTGFTALPGGYRDGSIYNTGYLTIGQVGWWWTSTPNSPTGSKYLNMGHNYSSFGKSNGDNRHGCSVRCLKN